MWLFDWKIVWEMLAASGVLMGGYVWLLERRTSLLGCRLYLLSLPLLSALIPLLRIPLWPSREAAVLPLDLEETGLQVISSSAAVPFSWELLFLLFYLLGVLFFGGIMAFQCRNIRALERGAKITEWEGVRLVTTDRPIASFSFFRTIYLPSQLTPKEKGIILCHESSHIRHHHSWERLAMEFQKAFFWWNPFVWLAVRRLTEVEEFEADRDVLESGEDASLYINTIFKQLFGYSPEIANGLRDSLTKKRFKMMKNREKSPYAGLRMVASLLLVPLCVLLFGTTARATQQPAMEELVVKSDVSDELKDSKPAFQGGTEIDFLRWVMGQVHYPADAAEKKISGRVLVQFTVKADGSVDQVKILSAPHDLLAQEVQRVVESSPHWEPALQDGSCVDVQFVLPFDFVL